MGKVRKVQLGDEKYEKEQAKKAEVRREAKKLKKGKTEDLSLESGEAPVVEKETEKKKKVTTGPKLRSKKYQEVAKLVEKTKLYSLKDAVSLVKKTSITSFDGTVEIHINLNPDALDGKTDMRGVVTLPHGTGKTITVAIADDAIINEIENGIINFDILVAHPSMMPKLAKVARVLGPKGLMPNPKTGTVTDNPEKRVKELSQGQINFKTEPENPIVHMSVGKVSFEDKQLIENIQAVIIAIGKGKIVKATLTATMGPGIKIAVS